MLFQKKSSWTAGDPITCHSPPGAPDAELRPSSMLTQPPHSRTSRGLSLPRHHDLPKPGGADAYRCPGRALPKHCPRRPLAFLPVSRSPGAALSVPSLGQPRWDGRKPGEVGLSFPAAGCFPPRPIFPHPVC